MIRPFDEFRSNIYSQNGEDGIIREIFHRLDLLKAPSWCVEFGAWDGKHLSNTFALIEQHKWNAVYIEGDPSKFEDLKKTASTHPTIHPVLAMVDSLHDSPTSLDNILKVQNIPTNFELLSIDIDSYDLEVWHSFINYKPKVVVIEINSSYLPGVLSWHSDKLQGNSFSSTLNVGLKKGYKLVAHTGNMIFVHEDYIDKICLPSVFFDYPELLYDPSTFSRTSFPIIKGFMSELKRLPRKLLNK